MLKPILCKAAVAYQPKAHVIVQQVWVDIPRQFQIRVQVISNALCHTDIYTLDGCDPEGAFPCILGHQATALVQSIGQGVTRVKPGDIIIPCYTPQCMETDCIFCQSDKTNLCPKIRATQGKGLMPDGTTRFKNQKGENIFHFMGCSTFSQFTVIAQISAAKINPYANLNQVCMIGCGISTGWGATMNNTNIKNGSTVAVWGLGAVGLSVIQGAKIKGAKRIYGIDINQKKFDIARKFGADICFKPSKQKSGKQFILDNEKWGVDYTFDCTGNVMVMRQALETASRGYGQSCVIGVAQSGKLIQTRPFQLVTGRKWLGTAFGGWKSFQDVPKLVNKATTQQWPIKDYITHEFQSLQKINQSVDALHSGECLRAVVKISQPPKIDLVPFNPKVVKNVKLCGGILKTVSHWSNCCNCQLLFNIFLPDQDIKAQRKKPYNALYLLAGLTCNQDNFPIKSGFGIHAKNKNIACIFPDTSPRNTNIEGINSDWTCGQSAGYYLNATSQSCSKHFNMFTYITQELPLIVSTFFPVSKQNKSITGFSMGGLGALNCSLKTGNFVSCSVFSPISSLTNTQWGKNATKLLMKEQKQILEYDPISLIKEGKYKQLPLFIQIGSNDEWCDNLRVDQLTKVLKEKHYKFNFQIRDGYNHSFYYVSSFIEQHFNFHAKYLDWYSQSK